MFSRSKPRKKHNQYEPRDKVPILVLDKNYYDLFRNMEKPEEIASLEKKLNELLKEQGQLNNDLKDYQKIKKDLMDKILQLTPDVFEKQNKNARVQMSKSQKQILKINDKLIAGELRLEDIKIEIETTNLALFDESAKICYDNMKNSKQRLAIITPQIEKIRAALKKKIDERTTHEENIKTTYSFLHKIVGAEIIDELDKKYGE